MTKMVMSLSVVVFLFGSLVSCNKDVVEINNSDEFESYVNAQMENQKIPALSVLIFKEGDILYENYFGKSNVELNTPLMQDDIFLLASVSKVVTATALLQLYEDGLFELDDNINDYLPFTVSIPNQSTPITFRMLLTHTSSIEDGSALDDQYYYGSDSPIALNFFLQNYLVPGGIYYNGSENFYDVEPGTAHEYSNSASALIGVLIEEISNQPFNTYCKDNIFQPLDLNHTFWRLDEAFQANATIAVPYNVSMNQYEAIQHYTFTDYPNGGLRSSARDLHKFLAAFVKGGNSNNYQLLNASTISEMITPQIPNIDVQVGLHMFVMNSDLGLWGHDGGEEGVSTIVAFNPTTKVGAIILANQGDAELDELLVEAYKLGLKL
jgi:CubicO group peptidase (beta-lactamase class C family)